MTNTIQTAIDTQGRAGAETRARKLADTHQTPMGIWEHVGDYGDPSGDIPARGTFTVRPLSRPDPGREWALIATVDPGEVL